MFNYTQLIHDFTRICSTISTTIYLILVSDSNNISQFGVIETSFRDHYMIFCTPKLSKSFIGSHNDITTRSLKNYSSVSFQANLLTTDWSSAIFFDNASEAWEHLKTFLCPLIAPVKQLCNKQRTEQWLESDILNAVKPRTSAFRQYRKEKSDFKDCTFKSLRTKT